MSKDYSDDELKAFELERKIKTARNKLLKAEKKVEILKRKIERMERMGK